MKQTRNLLVLSAIALSTGLFVACGGGTSSAESEAAAIPTDGLLGELPKVVAEYYAAEAAASAKYDELKASDPEKANAFWTDYISQGNTTKYKKETLPAISKTLEGIEIPAEIGEQLPMKLNGNFVLDDSREASVSGEFTEGASNDIQILTLKPVAFDSDGNALAIGPRGINFSDYPIKPGKTFSFGFFISPDDYNAASWAKLQKIVILDRQGEAYKQAEEQIKAAKDAFKNKQ